MSKWLPSILSFAALIAGAAAPQVGGLLAAHPQASLIVGSIFSIISSLLRSPLQSQGAEAKK